MRKSNKREPYLASIIATFRRFLEVVNQSEANQYNRYFANRPHHHLSGGMDGVQLPKNGLRLAEKYVDG